MIRVILASLATVAHAVLLLSFGAIAVAAPSAEFRANAINNPDAAVTITKVWAVVINPNPPGTDLTGRSLAYREFTAECVAFRNTSSRTIVRVQFSFAQFNPTGVELDKKDEVLDIRKTYVPGGGEIDYGSPGEALPGEQPSFATNCQNALDTTDDSNALVRWKTSVQKIFAWVSLIEFSDGTTWQPTQRPVSLPQAV